MMMQQYVSNDLPSGMLTTKNHTQQSMDIRDLGNEGAMAGRGGNSKNHLSQGSNVPPLPPQSVMQARARSVNATGGGGGSASKQAQLRAKFNKSSIQPAASAYNKGSIMSQEKNRSATAQGKQQFNFVSNQLQNKNNYEQQMILMNNGQNRQNTSNINFLKGNQNNNYLRNNFVDESNIPMGLGMPPSSYTPSMLQQAQGNHRQYAQMVNNSLQGQYPLQIETFLPTGTQNLQMNNHRTINCSTNATPLNHQRRVVKNGHSKAMSMNQTGRVQPMIYTGGIIPGGFQGQSNSKIVATEQFLNQPLTKLSSQQNNRIINNTIQYGQGSLQQLAYLGGGQILGSTPAGAPALYTPLNFQTIPIPETSLGYQNNQQFAGGVLSTRHAQLQQASPQTQTLQNERFNAQFQEAMASQGAGAPLGMYLYNPFTNYKRSGGGHQHHHGSATGAAPSLSSQSSSRISTQKMKQQMHNTISHIRSFSHYNNNSQAKNSSSHRRTTTQNKQSDRTAATTMMLNQFTSGHGNVIMSSQNNNNSTSGSVINGVVDSQGAAAANMLINQDAHKESQQIESEEYFEQGKVFLSDKKYKEAIKAFQKAVQLNKFNYDALFYRGVSQMDNNQPEKAIADLNELIDICPDYRKTVFIVLSIAYRRVNDYTGALRTLSKAIVKYPRYLEAFVARGQIHIFQKKWDKALSDFRVVISVTPDNGLGYLGQGDSLKGIGNYNGALQSYSQAIEIDQTCIQQGLMKRGILYLQMKYNEKALEDFNNLCDLAEKETSQDQQLSNTSNVSPTPQGNTPLAKSYFYKAKALKKLNNFNDAILYFEQVIRMCDDQFLQSSALYEIAKIKIQQKDFYEAYYNLQRATHYKLKQKKLINYKIFTEGVIFLMKRKTKTGLKLLTSLIEKITQSSQMTQQDYVTPLVYLYRAYGHFVSDDYDKALKDYIKSNQLKKLNTSATFNMIMCQGLKSLEKKEYENAISFFTKAGQKLPGNRDPYFLRAVSVVQYALHRPIKPQTKHKMLRDAKRDLNRALKHSPKDYQVMYFRGTLNFALHNFYDAITDFETVIEKSEETNAKHYLARGRCYACLSMFKEAITDLSIAINLNKDLLDAYLNRGKCAYLIGDTGLAFMDFQKLIVLEPKNPMVHIYAGNLLMTTGSYEDATKAFTNADNIHKSPLALYQRSRCQVALNNMQDALKDLNKVIEQSPNDKVAIADKECLTALKLASLGPGGGAQPSLQNNGSGNQLVVQQPFDRSIYEKAIVILTKLISYEKNEHLAKINHDSSVLYQHSQIIPSAQRTQADKIKAIRRRREQDRLVKQGGDHARKNDLRFRVQHQHDPNRPEHEDEMDEYDEVSELVDEKELEKLNRELAQASNDIIIETERSALPGGVVGNQGEKREQEDDEDGTNYYKENIFNKEDYYLYRAVMQFYSGDFEKAINDFDQSSSIMHSQKVLYPRNQFPDEPDNVVDLSEDAKIQGRDDDAVTINSSQTDLSDVGLCSLNIHEFSFNTVLCLLQMKDYKKALTKLDYIFDTIPKKYAGQLWLVRGLVNQQVNGHQHLAKKDFSRAYKYDRENAVRFLDQKQNVQLSIFPQQQRLCNGMAYIKFSFTGYSAAIYMKPSFSFPFIKPPNMIPCVDNSVLEQFTTKAIPLKPEAPWIKRCSFGIKFTDEIYFTDDDREATPDEEKEYKKRKQQQQQRAARAAATFMRSMSERVVLRTNIFVEGPPPTAVGGARMRGGKQPRGQNKNALNIDNQVDDEETEEVSPDHNHRQQQQNSKKYHQNKVEEEYEQISDDDDDDDDDDEEVEGRDILGRAADLQLNQRMQFNINNKQNHQHNQDDGDEGQEDDEDDDDDDIDEEEFKKALEKAKAAAEKLSERPRSIKK